MQKLPDETPEDLHIQESAQMSNSGQQTGRISQPVAVPPGEREEINSSNFFNFNGF